MFTRNWYKALAAQLNPNGWDSVSVGLVNFKNETFQYGSTYTCRTGIGYNSDYHPYIGRLTTAKSIGPSNTGVIIGSGITPPTIDDYKLENRIISSDITSDGTVTKNADNDGAAFTSLLTITNNSGEDITIGECGLYTNSGSGGDDYCVLIERTVLDSPVTIPAGGVGQLTYTIRMNYPTE